MRKPVLLRPAFLACALASATASAGDGVIEINAAAAQQGGVTTGDTPGYPVTLSRRGSYRLTGDLVSSTQTTFVIEITADDVSLDLGGFTVGACLGGGFCGTGNATLIVASGRSGVRIHDGVVQGAGGSCVFSGSRSAVENLRVSDCDGDGIAAGSYSRVAGVTVSDVGSVGVSLQIGAVLRDSVVTGAGVAGVNVSSNALLIDSMIENNALAIASSGFASVTRGGYRGCVITRNGEEEEQSISSALRDLGGNVCGSDTVCP